MKLYQVEVTYQTIILAENETDAEKQADYIVRHEADDDPLIVNASEISHASQVKQPWTPQCRPWGERDPYDRTIAQILQANTKTTDAEEQT